MKKIFVLLVALTATLGLWADSVITYTTKNDAQITLPGGVDWEVSVKSHTFTDGEGKIVFDGNLVAIPSYAFSDHAQLQTIVIPEGVTSIGEYAFRESVLAEVTFPSTLETIGEDAFSQCKLESLVLPAAVRMLGNDAFATNTDLTAIRCEAVMPPTCGEGCFLNVDKSIPVYVPAASVAAYTAADGWKDFTDIRLIAPEPTSFNTITYKAEEQLPEVEESSDSGLHINAFNAVIIDHTFADGEGTIYFSENVTNIGMSAFYNCHNLLEITIPASVRGVNSDAFRNCNGLTSITVEEGNTYYDSRDNCNAIIETATNKLVVGCQNTIIPSTVTAIAGIAFEGCTGLTSIEIPESVTSIGNHAFLGCTGLTDLSIAASVESIGTNAFVGCTALSSITCEAVTPPTCGIACFGSVDKDIPVYVPAESLKAYLVADEWKEFTNIIPFPTEGNSITYVAEEKLPEVEDWSEEGVLITAFNASIIQHTFNDGIGTIYFDDDVTKIGEYAFYGCTGISDIVIPSTVDSIEYAFTYCSALTGVVIPASVSYVTAGAFDGCMALESIRVEEGNAVYDSRKDCNAIIETETDMLIVGCQSTIIPVSVTGIGESAFDGRSGLTSVAFPAYVTYIGAWAFNNCVDLEEITFPASLEYLDDYVLRDCPALSVITCEAVTPPACSEDCFFEVDKTIPLYVPKSSVKAYKAADEWKDFTDIRAIGEEEGIFNANVNENANVNKRLMGGQLIIERAGKRYNLQGAELK